jgi:hypothetical protein
VAEKRGVEQCGAAIVLFNFQIRAAGYQHARGLGLANNGRHDQRRVSAGRLLPVTG